MKLAYELGPPRAAAMGLIVLQADETVERDMRVLLPEGAELLVSRVPSGVELSRESIAGMERALTGAAALFPVGAALSVVGYACTSASAQIGAGRVAELIRAGCDAARVTEPVSALLAACAARGVRRLGLVSPYVAAVSDRLREVLAEGGVEVVAFGSFDEPVEANVARISEGSILGAVEAVAGTAECDAVFVSCTNLRTLGVLADAETAIGRPVLSSNSVLAWHMARLASGAHSR